MQIHTTLFNMQTTKPYQPVVISAAVCGHCRHLVTIHNDSDHRWHYCGIAECSNSIIGCKPVKPARRACNRYAEGNGEHLTSTLIFRDVSIIKQQQQER